MQRIPLDVGRIIATQIRGVFGKPHGQLFFPWMIIGLCTNVALQSATLSVENEPVIPINGVINNKTLRRLLRGFQHQPELAKVPKGAPKPQAKPQPQPPRPKKKVVVVDPIEEIAVSPERCVHDSDACISSLPSPPLPKELRESAPPPSSPSRQTPPPSPITLPSFQSLSKHFSPPPSVLNPPVYESHYT